jgi:hypothetical protein
MTRASHTSKTARTGALLTWALLSCTLLTWSGAASAQTSFNWVVADSARGTALNVTSSFHTDIHNTGSVADTYRITMVSSMSASWVTTMCDVGLCYPPFITQIQYTVQPGASTYLGVNITPMVDQGHGTTWITVTSMNVPSLHQTVGFEVQSPATSPAPAPAAGLGLAAAPNPFNPRTTLRLDGGESQAGVLSLDVFDLGGRRVRALWRGEAGAARRGIPWDGADDHGRALPGGTYVARLAGPAGVVASVKLVLAK